MPNRVQDSQLDRWIRLCAVTFLNKVVVIEGKVNNEYSSAKLLKKFLDYVSFDPNYIDATKRYNEKKAQVDLYNLIKIIRVCTI